MTAVETPTLRLSSVRDCPRKAVYEAIGAPARDLSERERRILWSGKRIGVDYLNMLEAGGTGPIEREIKIPWAHGVGHADGWIPETRTIIEVLSSAHASDKAIDSKLVQLVLYLMHWEPADNGVLLIVDPRDYSDERVIVEKGKPQYERLAEIARERLAAVDAWANTGDLPACTGAANSWFCRFDDCPCKQPGPPLDEIDNSEARQTVLQFAQAKQAEKEAESVYELAKQQRLAVQEQLAALSLPAGKVKVGSYEVQRTHYAGRRTFNLTLAEKDSRFHTDRLAEFVKCGDPYDVWKVKRIDAAPAVTADDFGEETPF